MPSFRHQHVALAPPFHSRFGRFPIEGIECRKHRLKRAPKAPERGRLFLRELVVERTSRIAGPDVGDLGCERARWPDRHTLQISVQAALDNSFSIAAITRGSVGSICVAKLAVT